MRTIEECAEFIENVTGANLADNALSATVRMYANILDGIPFNRLQEICQAEREGRCVVLPCKVGETVYVTGERFPCEIQQIIITDDKIYFEWASFERTSEITECWDEGDFSIDEIGKTVFLTKSETEKALKERVENG